MITLARSLINTARLAGWRFAVGMLILILVIRVRRVSASMWVNGLCIVILTASLIIGIALSLR